VSVIRLKRRDPGLSGRLAENETPSSAAIPLEIGACEGTAVALDSWRAASLGVSLTDRRTISRIGRRHRHQTRPWRLETMRGGRGKGKGEPPASMFQGRGLGLEPKIISNVARKFTLARGKRMQVAALHKTELLENAGSSTPTTMGGPQINRLQDRTSTPDQRVEQTAPRTRKMADSPNRSPKCEASTFYSRIIGGKRTANVNRHGKRGGRTIAPSSCSS